MTDREIADALIKAGIGDLKEHRIFAGKDGSIKQLYSGEEVEKMAKERKELKDELRSKVEYIHEQDEVIKEYKHRAEIVERALIDCVEYYSYSALCPVLDCNYNKACWRKECNSDIVKCFKIQAEKELAEERKDGKMRQEVEK